MALQNFNQHAILLLSKERVQFGMYIVQCTCINELNILLITAKFGPSAFWLLPHGCLCILRIPFL